METAEIVKIAVSAAPYSIDKPYDYLVPPELLETAVPGVRARIMPSLVRLPRPKGTVTRTPGTAVSSSSGGTK